MILGIDPGKNGAATLLSNTGQIIDIIEFNKTTEHDICEAIKEHKNIVSDLFCFIEKCHSMPKQGVSSSFKFGNVYGFIRGAITMSHVPFEFVTPQVWQKALGCLSKGDKNITKAKAQQLFPDEKITHSKADSILIAEYGRRKRNNL